MSEISEETGQVFLPKSAFTVYQIDNLFAEFQNILKNKNPIIVSMEAVEEIDSMGLQLLISACKLIRKQDCKFRCINCNEVVKSFLDRSGVASDFFLRSN